jgi:hypothetical protein
MTLRESELSRSRCATHSHHNKQHKQRSALDALPPMLNDDQVLTFGQWVALNAISKRTGRRILDSGNGPIITQLSAKRIGITVGNNRRWQEARARS